VPRHASTYRPNNQEPSIDGEELPSYYEMIPPPAYKSKRLLSNRDSALLAEINSSPSLPSTSNDERTSPSSNVDLIYNDSPPPFTPNPILTISSAITPNIRGSTQ
jgi:hypothetical protein